MSKLITSESLEEFVQEVITASREDLIPSLNVKPTGYGVGQLGRMATFEVLTKECGKVYVGRGLAGMTAIVSELAADDREIRSVTPVSVYKDRLNASGYTMMMLDKPKTYTPEDVIVTVGEVEIEGHSTDEPITIKKVDTEEVEIQSVDEDIDEEVVENELPSDTELTKMSKKDLLKMLKDRNLAGNIQQTKGVMIKKLRDNV